MCTEPCAATLTEFWGVGVRPVLCNFCYRFWNFDPLSLFIQFEGQINIASSELSEIFAKKMF